MKKQTAVDWLQEAISKKLNNELGPYFIDLFDNAKAMEKEQIEDAFGKERIVVNGEGYFKVFNSKQYYNETYKQD